MAFQVGEEVGPYRITDKLGQGGMATVYRAHHANLDRYVAIKVLHTAFKDDPTFLERFKREAQIVARLDHPHIIPIYDFADHQGQPYLVMKFIEGETLKARLKRGPLTLDQTLTMMDAVAQALTYAHTQGILHRDIKPSNIMLDRDNIPYIADFGLARIAQAGESTLSQDVMLGTPQYISPEQAKGVYDLGPSTDIYSLGVVLYEIVVGRVPFNADTPYAIVHDHIYKALPLPTKINPQVPAGVEQVLLRSLAKDPTHRYQSANDMMAAFRDAVQHAGMTELSAVDTPPQAFEVSSSAVTAPQIAATSTPYPTPGSTPATPVYTSVPSPITQSTTQHMLQQKEAYRRRANLWILGGIGLLLFTCLASLFIIARAVSDPDSRPWNISDTVDAEDSSSPPPQDSLTSMMDMDELSVEEAEGMILEAPDDPIPHIQLGMALMREGNTESGLEHILLALDTLRIPPEALNAFARTLIQEDRHDLAFLIYLDMLSHEGGTPQQTNQAGQFLYTYTLDNPVSARAITETYSTYRQASTTAEIINALALLQADRTLSTRQAKTLLDSIALEKDLPEFYLVRGLYYLRIDEIERALNDWHTALDVDRVPQWIVEVANQLIDQHSLTTS